MSSVKNRRVICIGISPFNSRFSTEYISKLLLKAQESADHIVIFYPGKATINSLLAKGYDPVKAQKKLTKQSRYCLNKIRTAIETTSDTRDCSIEVIDGISDFENNKAFQNCVESIRDVLLSNKALRFEFEKFAKDFLGEPSPTHFQLDSVKEYILAESPFIINGEQLFCTRNYSFYYENSPNLFTLLKEEWNSIVYHELSSLKHGVL